MDKDINIDKYSALTILSEELGTITHKINNLVFPVLGFSELAIKQYADNTHGEQNIESQLKTIYEFAEELSKVLNRLSANDKLDFGDFAIVDAKRVLDEIFDLVSLHIPERIKIKKNFSELGSVNIRYDNQLLSTIINNVVNNAVEAIEEEGFIDVVAQTVDVSNKASYPYSFMKQPQYLVIKIHDNGCGISDEALEKALYPFFTTKPGQEHHGLGLWEAECKAINLGGGITLEKDNIQGTIVNVFLPIDPNK